MQLQLGARFCTNSLKQIDHPRVMNESEQSEKTHRPWSFRYYTPPFIINGYVYTLGIKRRNNKKEPYQFTLFQCDTHHSNYTEELPITCHLTPQQQEIFINLCVHYHNNFSQCKMIMFKTINHEEMQFELIFKINLETHTMIIQQCKDVEMIANYDLFLQKPQFEDWDTHSTQAARLLGDKTIYRIE